MAWHPFRGIARALGNLFSGVRAPSTPSQPSYNPQAPRFSERRQDRIRDRDQWSGEFSEPDAAQKWRIYEKIRGWNLTQSNANRIGFNIEHRMSDGERDLVELLDVQGFREMAKVNRAFWYH